MSSGHEESVEPSDEGPVRSDGEKSISPSPKKGQSGGGEHAKPKRRGRRGKKRKQRKESGDSQPSGAVRSDISGSAEISGTNVSAADSELEESRSFEWDSNDEPEVGEAYSGQLLRPNAPHAPKNSTQFIIDDHNACHLYMSFETPNPYLSNITTENNGDVILQPIGEDAAFIDIDYQYESPQDFDNTAYYDREFELSYRGNRFEELLRLPRERLVSGLRALEAKLKELSDDLVKENPSPILERLQGELLELQEKNCELKEANTRLSQLVAEREEDLNEGWTKKENLEEDSVIESKDNQAVSPGDVSLDFENEPKGTLDGLGDEIGDQLDSSLCISNAKQANCDTAQDSSVLDSHARLEPEEQSALAT